METSYFYFIIVNKTHVTVTLGWHDSKVVDTLCAQLTLKFYADSFDTLLVFGHGLTLRSDHTMYLDRVRPN